MSSVGFDINSWINSQTRWAGLGQSTLRRVRRLPAERLPVRALQVLEVVHVLLVIQVEPVREDDKRVAREEVRDMARQGLLGRMPKEGCLRNGGL